MFFIAKGKTNDEIKQSLIDDFVLNFKCPKNCYSCKKMETYLPLLDIKKKKINTNEF